MNGGTALAPRRVPGHGQVWGTQIYDNGNDEFLCHLGRRGERIEGAQPVRVVLVLNEERGALIKEAALPQE
jgi:hypothetical protein